MRILYNFGCLISCLIVHIPPIFYSLHPQEVEISCDGDLNLSDDILPILVVIFSIIFLILLIPE